MKTLTTLLGVVALAALYTSVAEANSVTVGFQNSPPQEVDGADISTSLPAGGTSSASASILRNTLVFQPFPHEVPNDNPINLSIQTTSSAALEATANFADSVTMYQEVTVGGHQTLEPFFLSALYSIAWTANYSGNLPQKQIPGGTGPQGWITEENLNLHMSINNDSLDTVDGNGTAGVTFQDVNVGLIQNKIGTVEGRFGGLSLVNLFNLNFFADLSGSIICVACHNLQAGYDLSFQDPWQFTVYDSNGNIVPNIVMQSADGFAYNVTDGFNPNATTTPLPAALPLFATGLGGLGLLGWRRKRKAPAAD